MDSAKDSKRAKKSHQEKSATFLTEEFLKTTSSQSKQAKNNSKTVKSKGPKKPINVVSTVETATTSKTVMNTETTTDTSENINFNCKSTNSKRNRDLEARYWTYLLASLIRAVDEIYLTCENDENISKCKEVIMIIEKCSNDFRSLIKRIQMMRDYEKATNSRPNSVAWEVRKLSSRNKLTKKLRNELENKQSETGFRDFLPEKFKSDAFEIETKSNTDFDDEDLDLDDFDHDDYLLKTSSKFQDQDQSDSIDLLNYETFSDLQSINTDDLNGNYSKPITPPLGFTPQKQPNNIQNGQIQEQMSLYTSWMPLLPNPNQLNSRVDVQLNQEINIGCNNLISNSSEAFFIDNTQQCSLASSLNNRFLFNDLYKRGMNDSDIEYDKTKAHHNNIMKFYEEEEKNIELEIKQDEKLLFVLENEARLTRQLSVEQLINFANIEADNKRKKNNDIDPNNSTKSYYKKDYLNEESDSEQVRTPSRIYGRIFSWTRKESPNEKRRKHEEKQARAQEKREQFYQERLDKLRELTKKIEAVNELKKKLLRAKKATMKAKLQRAEEKRLYLLRLKANKASVEEQKAHEIAFINSLAAQNRKHDILEKYEKRNEVIKQNQEEERMRKQEEQKAKEHAAELRRRELETQRKARLSEMLEKRRLKESKIEQIQIEKEKERIEVARAKEKTREMRLATMEAQFQASKQQAQRKLIQKQEEWCKRHELNLEEIRKKAFEMSVLRFSSEEQSSSVGGTDAPTSTPYENAKWCKVCQVVISSDLQLKSHLRGIKHQQTMSENNQGKTLTKNEIEEYNLSCIIDEIPKEMNQEDFILNRERIKLMKKRVKKLKSRLMQNGIEYELSKSSQQVAEKPLESTNNIKSKVPKLLKELEKISNSNDRYNPIVDRNCNELNRLLQKNNQEKVVFFNNNGLNICIRLLEQINNINLNGQQNQRISAVSTEIISNSTKTTNNLISVLISSVQENFNSCLEILLSNKLLSLVEILNLHSKIMLFGIEFLDCLTNKSINITAQNTKSQQRMSNEWLICSNLLHLIGLVFSSISANKKYNEFNQRILDFISLIANYGLIDTLSIFFDNVHGPINDDQQTSEIIRNCLKFLTFVTKFLIEKKTNEISLDRKVEDSTQLISVYRTTNLVNIVPMLYGMLHNDISTPIKSITNKSTSNKQKNTISIELTTIGVHLLNHIAILDLNMFQSVLSEESLSLQLRHIASYLISYSSTIKNYELLHEIILLIGYFTALNNENQLKIELGTPPTILQQLCNLSFNYFTDKKLISILYPTLICCCFKNEKNKLVLCNELNGNILASFIQEKIKEYSEKKANENNEEAFEKKDVFELQFRFPCSKWKEANEYFSN